MFSSLCCSLQNREEKKRYVIKLRQTVFQKSNLPHVGQNESVKACVSSHQHRDKIQGGRLKQQPWTPEPSSAAANCLRARSQHAPPSWSQRRGKKWDWGCERVVCFPTSLDARRLNLPAIWGGRDPQGRRREGNRGGCFLCSLSTATHWELREDRQESC